MQKDGTKRGVVYCFSDVAAPSADQSLPIMICYSILYHMY